MPGLGFFGVCHNSALGRVKPLEQSGKFAYRPETSYSIRGSSTAHGIFHRDKSGFCSWTCFVCSSLAMYDAISLTHYTAFNAACWCVRLWGSAGGDVQWSACFHRHETAADHSHNCSSQAAPKPPRWGPPIPLGRSSTQTPFHKSTTNSCWTTIHAFSLRRVSRALLYHSWCLQAALLNCQRAAFAS